MVECILSMPKALGSVPTPAKTYSNTHTRSDLEIMDPRCLLDYRDLPVQRGICKGCECAGICVGMYIEILLSINIMVSAIKM